MAHRGRRLPGRRARVAVAAAAVIVVAGCGAVVPGAATPPPDVPTSASRAPVTAGATVAATSRAAVSAGTSASAVTATSGPAAGEQTAGPTGGGTSAAAPGPGVEGDLLAGRMFVALYGSPGIAGLGALGQQDLPAALDRVQDLADQYRPLTSRSVVPMFEIIATIADVAPGDDGDYSAEIDPAVLEPWIDAATAAGVYVVLDLQPGRSDFLSQARRYETLLRRPDVGLALDPEWRLTPNQVHLEQIGSVSAAEVNAVGDWLAALTRDAGLPPKLFLLHQFRLSMLRDEAAIVLDRPELATVIQMDGQGSQAAKDETWAAVTAAAPPGTPFGWKNFYRRDSTLLDPAGTMAKLPTPVLVSYE